MPTRLSTYDANHECSSSRRQTLSTAALVLRSIMRLSPEMSLSKQFTYHAATLLEIHRQGLALTQSGARHVHSPTAQTAFLTLVVALRGIFPHLSPFPILESPFWTDQPMSYLADQLKERGNSAFHSGDYLEAEDLYTQAVQKYSRNPLIFTNRANVRLKLQRWDGAVNDCLKSIEISGANGQNHKAFYFLGKANLVLY